jgi:hypothetical protein
MSPLDQSVAELIEAGVQPEDLAVRAEGTTPPARSALRLLRTRMRLRLLLAGRPMVKVGQFEAGDGHDAVP